MGLFLWAFIYSIFMFSPDGRDVPIKEIEPSVYKIGNLILDANSREIKIPGWVNMDKGLVELLACGVRGKTHESVLVLDVNPYYLQVALFLLGLEPRGNLKYQGDPNPPQGDSVLIYVEWESNGKKVKVRGEDLVYNVKEKRPMKRTPWVFTGSKIYKGRFMAEIEESLITTYHDPYTIIDNPLPEGGDDTVYWVNEKIVPPKGTKILMTIKPFR